MKRTEHYDLPTWEATDRILMKDFNDMTAKIDAAMPRWRLYSYVGTGTYGPYNKSQFTFPERPLLVWIIGGGFTALIPGFTDIFSLRPVGVPDTRTGGGTWQGNTMTWYNTNEAGYQLNALDVTYYCLALFAEAPEESE